MELFLDTANIKEIKLLREILTFDGITTNPTIIAGTGKSFEVVVQELIDVLDNEQKLFIQVIAEDCAAMIEEAKYINCLRNNTYAKIPVTTEGLKAIKICKEQDLNILATAIYTANQAFMAALLGADYLAPYVNRMENLGNGVEDVIDLIEMLRANELDSKIVAASFKNTEQVHELIKNGIHAVTIPTKIARAMCTHPSNQLAVTEFTDEWYRAYGRKTLL